MKPNFNAKLVDYCSCIETKKLVASREVDRGEGGSLQLLVTVKRLFGLVTSSSKNKIAPTTIGRKRSKKNTRPFALRRVTKLFWTSSRAGAFLNLKPHLESSEVHLLFILSSVFILRSPLFKIYNETSGNFCSLARRKNNKKTWL